MASRWKFNRIATLGAVTAVITLVVLFRGGGVAERHPAEAIQTSSVLTAMDLPAVAKQTRGAERVAPAENVHALVVPHHVPPAGQLIADAFGVLRARHPRTIVIVGPDHPDRGRTLFTVTAHAWSGAGKTYAINQGVVRTLQTLHTVSMNDDLIREEHSVLVPLPYAAARFPNAQFVLITVRSPFNFSELEDMAQTLHRALGPNDFVVASIDFSHYKPLQEAHKDDEKSVALLHAMNPAQLKDIPADSPGSLAIAILFAKLRGAQNVQILEQSNSALLIGDPGLQSTTSYITAAVE